MTGEDFKTEAEAAFAKYKGKEDKSLITDDPADPPKDSESAKLKTGIKALLHDFGLEKSLRPLTLLKIYGNWDDVKYIFSKL